jgi:hypothetical protein
MFEFWLERLVSNDVAENIIVADELIACNLRSLDGLRTALCALFCAFSFK